MIEKCKAINLLLHSAAILALISCIFAEFLTFNTFQISLFGVTNTVSYEDVRGSVYASFSNFESFACRKSRNEGILTVCGNILNFEISGILLQLTILLSILGNISVAYGVFIDKKLSKVQLFMPLICFFTGSCVFLAITEKDLLDPADNVVQVDYSSGCFLMFVANAMLVACLSHYYYNGIEELAQVSASHDAEDQHQNSFLKGPIEKYVSTIINKSHDDLKSTIINDIQHLQSQLLNSQNTERALKSSIQQCLHILEATPLAESSAQFAKIKQILSEPLERGKDLEDIETKRFNYEEEKKEEESPKKVSREKWEKTSKELADMKIEFNRLMVVAESRLEETETQKRILENNKQVLVEKQLKIEELEKAKRNAETKEKNSAEAIMELKKYLKEYEELMIQIKKDKDEVMRNMQSKESELELVQSQYFTVKSEVNALKSAFSGSVEAKPSVSDIQLHSLNSQVAILEDSLKKFKEEKNSLQEKCEELQRNNENLDFKLKNSIQDSQNSMNRIYELENMIKESSEVKSKYIKALDEIQDLSTMIESFRKEASESKIQPTDSFYISKITKKREKAQNLKKDLKESLKKNKELLKDLDEKAELLVSLQGEIKAMKENENGAYKKLQENEEEWERIKVELVHTNSAQSKEIELITARMKTQESFFEKELQSTQLALESAKDQSKKQTIEADYLKNECVRLEKLEEKLKSGLPEDLQAIIEENSQQFKENCASLSLQIDKILSEKEKLRKKLQETESELQVVSEECQQLHKLRFENRKEETFSMSSVESSSRSIQDSLIIAGISPSIVFHNPLLEKISQLRKEPPMTYSTVWKNLEMMMLEKLKIDKVDYEIGRAPRNVADFMFEFMYKQYGLKALGLKQLKALVVSLEELYKIQHPYANFFCRVMGIFHPRPIPGRVSVFLFAAQELFNGISRKPSPKSENFPEIYEIQQFGGEAFIGDVVDLVKKIFKNHRNAGERVLDSLHRDQPDKLEITILKICAALKKLGKNEEFLIETLKPVGESVDYQEFIDCIRDSLEIWISQEEAELLCSYFDEGTTGEIALESWKQKIMFEDFCGKMGEKAAMVTKADFLNSLISEYEYEALEDYHELRKTIKNNSISPEQASHYLLQIDPDLSLDVQERLFKEALVHDGGKGREVSSEALCIVILKHNIGGFGKGLFHLETILTS